MLNSYKKFILIIIVIIPILISFFFNKKIVEYFEELSREGLNRFDGIVYINLEKRGDRQKHICKMLDNYGVDSSRVHKISGSYIPKNGHKGCAQSHILALTMAKINNWENMLVLEDDFTFIKTPQEVNNSVNKMFNDFKDNWDVVMFATNGKKERKLDLDYIVGVDGNAATTSGYAINKPFYDKLLNNFKTANDNMKYEHTTSKGWEKWAIDQQWKKLQPESRWYCFEPVLGKQAGMGSTIQRETNYKPPTKSPKSI